MHHFQPEHYADRRNNILQTIGEEGVAIFTSPQEKVRSNDTTYPYRPSSDIVYLSGFEEPETVLVLAPGHKDGDFFMFVRTRDPLREQWEGRRYGTEGAVATFGADKAYPVERFEELLPTFFANRNLLYYTLGCDTTYDSVIVKALNSLRYQRHQPFGAPARVADARDLVHPRRMIKRPEEISTMRKAAEISSKAHELAIAAGRPGVWEYQIQAIMEHHFVHNGAFAPAYSSIVGTGVNATILHYIENTSQLKEGDVVLMDVGCEYDYYAADISRSFPASGRFTPEQRDMYEIVLECELACIDKVRKGTPFNQIKVDATRILTEGLVTLGILNGSLDELLASGAYRLYYPHSIGHYLGMDVHDVGTTFLPNGEDLPLAPGMVVTIEPGLYIPIDDENAPKGLRGVGIRIEDDVLCTDGDPDVLTASCPKSVSEMEKDL